MANELDGRIALVTGASRGLGRDIAARLAAAGAAVALVDRKARWSEDFAQEIESAGGRAIALGCDVSDREALHAAFDAAVEALGGLDVVVNNAMWTRYAPVEEIEKESLDRMLGVGIAGIVWGTQAAARYMRPRGGGAIVNIASVSARMGLPEARQVGPVGGVVIRGIGARAPDMDPRAAFAEPVRDAVADSARPADDKHALAGKVGIVLHLLPFSQCGAMRARTGRHHGHGAGRPSRAAPFRRRRGRKCLRG